VAPKSVHEKGFAGRWPQSEFGGIAGVPGGVCGGGKSARRNDPKILKFGAFFWEMILMTKFDMLVYFWDFNFQTTNDC